MSRRLAAIVALVVGAADGRRSRSCVAVSEFPRGLVVLACVLVAGAAAWYGVLRRGRRARRRAGRRRPGARRRGRAARRRRAAARRSAGRRRACSCRWRRRAPTLAVHVDLPAAPPPQQPVLFYNPKSGGGKAERFALADEARARGIEPIELEPGVGPRGARARGGRPRRRRAGDGRRRRLAGDRRGDRRRARSCPTPASRPARATTSRSTSASTATTSSAPSTRSSTAASARVDLAEVNGRVFVNNVSLGLYAEAVQREGYRDAKLRTLLDTVPDVLGPDGGGLDLRWTGPGRARAPRRARRSSSPTTATGSAARSARARGRGSTTACSGSRSSARPPGAASGGRLPQRPWREWSAPDVRGRRRPPGPRRHRRRGARRSTRRCGSASGPASCACGSPARTPAPRRRRWHPRRVGRRARAGADRRRARPEGVKSMVEPHRRAMQITPREPSGADTSLRAVGPRAPCRSSSGASPALCV